VGLALWGGGCAEPDLGRWRGTVTFVAPLELPRGGIRSAPEAAALLRRASPLPGDPLPEGTPLSFVAVLRGPAKTLQLGVLLTESSETEKRVAYVDQLDVGPGDEAVAGVLRPPPGAGWPRACRSYRLALSARSGELAKGRWTAGGCQRALDALRGGVLFHVGKGGPPLFDFAGTLADYRAAIGAQPALRGPASGAFFLGWKAAFPGPAGSREIEATLREAGSGRVVDRRPLAVDPAWDSLGGGWEIPPESQWPSADSRYELTLSRGGVVLARGELTFAGRRGPSPR
jgi:hypothetical protein